MNQKNNHSILQIARAIIQIVLFIFLPGLYIGALNGIKAIYLAVLHHNMSASFLTQIIEVAAVLPVTALLGRFFCGWMCGFGSYSDFIYRLSQKLFHKKVCLNERTDQWMKTVKYILLAIITVFVWTFDLTVFNTSGPWEAFGMLATVGKMPNFPYVIMNLTAGFILLVAVTVAGAFVERFFCRYLCPMGAVFSLASRLRIAKIKKTAAQCGNCRACTNRCSMGIPLYRMDTVDSGECINCMKCIRACPRGNVDFSIAKKDVRPLIAGTAAVAAMTGIYFTGSFTAAAAAARTDSAVVSSSGAQSAVKSTVYRDGTYQGSGTGFRGATTTVSVTIKSDRITDVTTESYGDDDRFYNAAFSGVVPNIISSQSADVDAVSGATYSSNGIMQAVADALGKAI